ncbi:MAG: hypothetical protein KGJ59_01305 [Bacteroidota bacterium]|nr:hypothetical protein [Bacteroidota bacterium]
MNNVESEIHDAMAAINRAWRESRPSEMEPYLHPQVTMAFPGFSGTIVGKDALLANFVEFCSNACVFEYKESDEETQSVYGQRSRAGAWERYKLVFGCRGDAPDLEHLTPSAS